MNNEIIYSITMYIKVSNDTKYTYCKFAFDDCHNLIDNDFFERIKEDAILGVKTEYNLEGNLVAEFVEEAEYNSFNTKSSVKYDITPDDIVRTEKY